MKYLLNNVTFNLFCGAHLLLFFLAFVFGSFCTFCFHMLMYLFDEKCVLFPKLLSLSSFRQNVIYEFIPEDKEVADRLPVDFVSTQWVEKSACLLPTYVPLVSGILGLVWTTMFLMCSTGSRVLTGLQRPWRVLPPVFLFSVIMGILCVYTSTVTHYGLQELCLKLSEITGSSKCTYTINVATLAYERRIRGVYQATRLTILSAWLHTACWVLSALLSLMRVILAVDFQLVKVTVQLRGNIDRMLEQHEKHIRTVSPEILEANQPALVHNSRNLIQLHFKKKFRSSLLDNNEQNIIRNTDDDVNLLYYSGLTKETSDLSLVQIERDKLRKRSAYRAVAKKHRFIVKMLYDLLDDVHTPHNSDISSSSSLDSLSESVSIIRQYGQQHIMSRFEHKLPDQNLEIESEDLLEAEEISSEIKRHLQMKLNRQLSELNIINIPSTSSMNITPEMQKVLDDNKGTSSKFDSSDSNKPATKQKKKKTELKSNLKQVGIQTDEKMKDKSLKVKIDSRTSVIDLETSTTHDETTKKNKQTQTKKEKQE